LNGDGSRVKNGGDQSKEKKNGRGPELKKKKKKYSLNFFFFGIGGDHGHHRSPPNPSLSLNKLNLLNFHLFQKLKFIGRGKFNYLINILTKSTKL
jgi:hypothetical protein